MCRTVFVALLVVLLTTSGTAQESKRNDRPKPNIEPAARSSEPTKTEADASRYTYEFKQPQFVINHVVIEHDASGRGKITFARRGEEVPIVEPIQLSETAWGRISRLWNDLRFLDSTENYQSPKNFAHLGTYRVGIDDGKRQRTAEFNWTSNKAAWELVTEYRRATDQAILVFNLELAREMQPLNAPSLLKEMEMLLARNGLSDPNQLVPLLSELRSDEHIPLIARNHAERILKKIAK